jgi:hypothetical protein
MRYRRAEPESSSPRSVLNLGLPGRSSLYNLPQKVALLNLAEFVPNNPVDSSYDQKLLSQEVSEIRQAFDCLAGNID